MINIYRYCCSKTHQVAGQDLVQSRNLSCSAFDRLVIVVHSLNCSYCDADEVVYEYGWQYCWDNVLVKCRLFDNVAEAYRHLLPDTLIVLSCVFHPKFLYLFEKKTKKKDCE